jgi:MFS family permease
VCVCVCMCVCVCVHVCVCVCVYGMQGLAWPAIHSMMSRWFPNFELSRAVCFFTSGSYFGTVLTVLTAPPLISRYRWPSAFYVFGGLGFVFVGFWNWCVVDAPHLHATIHADELLYIETYTRAAVKSTSTVPYGILFRSKQVWAFFANMFASGWGFFVLLSWMPDYFATEMHVNLSM